MSLDKYNTYVEWVGDEVLFGQADILPNESPQGTFDALMDKAHEVMARFKLNAVWSTLNLEVMPGEREENATLAGVADIYVGLSKIVFTVSVLRLTTDND